LQAGIQVSLNGIGNLTDGNNFFDNWYWSAGMGFLTGAIAGYNMANEVGLNPWTGGLKLETKLQYLLYANESELLSEIGEAGVENVYLGNRKNLAGTKYKNYDGDILSPNGELVNGFAERGKYFGTTNDRYI
jgi:hypothetical protein